MLPGLRLVAAAIAAAMIVVVLGIGALARLQVAHEDAATLPPPEARSAGLAFAERADWTPDLTARHVSLESLPPFAKSPSSFNPPKPEFARPATKTPEPNIVVAINPPPLDLTPGPGPIEPVLAPPPAPTPPIASGDALAVSDRPLLAEAMPAPAAAEPMPMLALALPPDLSIRAVEIAHPTARAPVRLPEARPKPVRIAAGPSRTAVRRVARHKPIAHVKPVHHRSRRPVHIARRPAAVRKPAAAPEPPNPFAAFFDTRPRGGAN